MARRWPSFSMELPTHAFICVNLKACHRLLLLRQPVVVVVVLNVVCHGLGELPTTPSLNYKFETVGGG